MDITFKDKKLRKLANDDRKLVKEFGKIRADKIRGKGNGLAIWTSLTDWFLYLTKTQSP